MKHSIHFDPTTDSLAAVTAAVALLFGGTAATVVHSIAAPTGADTDNDADDANTPAIDPTSLDANGIPHDKRIHSEKPSRVAGNVWRKRKGVQETTVNEVTAELRARVAASGIASPAGAPAPATPATPPAPPAPAAPAAPAAPVAPAAPPAPPPAVNQAYTEFVQFVDAHRVTPANESNPHALISAQWLGDTLKYYGIESGNMVDLMNADPAKIAEIQAGMRVALGYPS